MDQNSSHFRTVQPQRARYNAYLKEVWGARFASPLFNIVFVFVLILLLYFLYPQQRILSEIGATHGTDIVANQYLRQLVRIDPHNGQLQYLLARQNLNIDNVKLAIDGSEVLSPREAASLAKIALSFGLYRQSANLYFLAQNKTITLAQKRTYFLAGIKTLQSGNLLNEALIAAEKHIGSLSSDRITLLFLAKLALSANNPKLAQEYMRKIIF